MHYRARISLDSFLFVGCSRQVERLYLAVNYIRFQVANAIFSTSSVVDMTEYRYNL